MLYLYGVAAVLIGLAIVLYCVRGLFCESHNFKLLEKFVDEPNAKEKVLPALIELRTVERPIIHLPGSFTGRSPPRPPDTSDSASAPSA
jgi:hypothetical protein